MVCVTSDITFPIYITLPNASSFESVSVPWRASYDGTKMPVPELAEFVVDISFVLLLTVFREGPHAEAVSKPMYDSLLSPKSIPPRLIISTERYCSFVVEQCFWCCIRF